MAPEDFETLLLEKTESARKEYPDLFKRFFIKGGGHCVQNYSYAVNGVSIWDWIGYLVANDPRWADILEERNLPLLSFLLIDKWGRVREEGACPPPALAKRGSDEHR
jgi:hypothetical protein